MTSDDVFPHGWTAEDLAEYVRRREAEPYANSYVLKVLEDLSMHTTDELQSRIQSVYMWLREQQ